MHKDLRTSPSLDKNHVLLRENLLADSSSWGIIGTLILKITLPLTLAPPTQTASTGDYSDSVISGVTNTFVCCMGLASLLLILGVSIASARYQVVLATSPGRIPTFLQHDPCFPFIGSPQYPQLVGTTFRFAYLLFVVGSCAGVFLSSGWVPCVVAVVAVVVIYFPFHYFGGMSYLHALDATYKRDDFMQVGASTSNKPRAGSASPPYMSGRVPPETADRE